MGDDAPGRIVTFYSFKGGVGRSMALANVAFIAAMNSKRVLVMDWDLEAPGLAYYFRGLTDPQVARHNKSAPGILDLAWEWVSTVREQRDANELEGFLDRFRTGNAFTDKVRQLVDPFEIGAHIDILSAGGELIGAQKRPYEEALAEFSWPLFFRADGGGVLLSYLIGWAKENYDFILVDSRTGLADVAGICTMQIPDDVALCFILNRQNMEGVARVAGAIRAKRSEEVKLHAIPMRVASQETAEESAARARARRELVTIGGFSGERVDSDFRRLAISASPNVPFYETLAPIAVDDPLKDPLSQNYLAMASTLLNTPFEMPILDSDDLERIRHRLEPRHVTTEYLLQLKSRTPDLAFAEVVRLVESALDAQLEHDADLDDEYLQALVRTAFDVADESEYPFETISMLNQAVDIVRTRASEDPADWRQIHIDALIRMLDLTGYLEPEDEQPLLEEIEALLVVVPTTAVRLMRLRYRRRAARLYLLSEAYDAAFESIASISQIIDSLNRTELAQDQMALVHAAEADIFLLRGDIYFDKNEFERALAEYRKGRDFLIIIEQGEHRQENSRLRFDIAYRLATRFENHVEADQKAAYALEASALATGPQASTYYVELAGPIIQSNDAARMSLSYIQTMFKHERITALSNYHGRSPRNSKSFFEVTARLLSVVSVMGVNPPTELLADVARSATLVSKLIVNRRATQSGRAPDLVESINFLWSVLEQSGCSTDSLQELRAAAHYLETYSPLSRLRPGGTGRTPP